MELLLSEHQGAHSELGVNSEVFLETDVAEVLQVSWCEKRAELSRLQKARKFTAAKDLRRSFRVEVEELKRKTKCHRCGKQGHWSRECKQPRKDGPSKTEPSRTTASTSGAALVHVDKLDFVACVDLVNRHQVDWIGHDLTMLEQLRERNKQRQGDQPVAPCDEVLLVSSPGFGVLDSGCGRRIIGMETLSEFEKLLEDRSLPRPTRKTEYNSFRFGNGATEVTSEVAMLPCFLAGRRGIISAAVVQGKAPLLISRGALQTLKACLDFQNNRIQLFDDRVTVPLSANSAGQYVIDVLDGQALSSMTARECHEPPAAKPVSEALPVHTSQELEQKDENEMIAESQQPADEVCLPTQDQLPAETSSSPRSKYMWVREDWGSNQVPISTSGGPSWNRVRRRVVRNAHHGKILWDEQIDHSRPKTWYLHQVPQEISQIVTEFHHDDPNKHDPKPALLTKRECRKVQQQFMSCATVERTQVRSKRMMVVEVFSPPRFSSS